MKKIAFAFASGLLFAVGLGVAGMTQPSKVLGFLDVAGTWDPSLAFVMGAALAVDFVAFSVILRRPRPRIDAVFHLPTLTRVDARLVGGAVLFGLGWGLSGVCPGPAVVAVASAQPEVLVFVAAMAGGMGTFHAVEAWRRSGRQAATGGAAADRLVGVDG